MRSGAQNAPVNGASLYPMRGVFHARNPVRKRGQPCPGDFDKPIGRAPRTPGAGNQAPVGQHRRDRQRGTQAAAQFAREREQPQGARSPVGIDGNEDIADQRNLLRGWGQFLRPRVVVLRN